MTLKLYAAYLIGLSFLTFCFYVADKGKAKRNAWRIPEKVLLTASFFGGAIGGYLAMYLVRHKTKKGYFHFVNLLGIAWQIALLVYLIGNPHILF